MLSESSYAGHKQVCNSFNQPAFISISRGIYRHVSREYRETHFINMIELAPSESLHDDYQKNRIDWNQYVVRFLKEMEREESRQAIKKIVEMSLNRDVFLLCHCGIDRGFCCHRYLVLNLCKEYASREGIKLEVFENTPNKKNFGKVKKAKTERLKQTSLF